LLNKLVKKFHAKSYKHLIIIFIIFALSGSGSLFLSNPILLAINLEKLVTFYPLYILIRIIIIVPIYQLMLIVIATILGEFKYFWKFEKKFLQRIKLIK
jgi:hypothetical protein